MGLRSKSRTVQSLWDEAGVAAVEYGILIAGAALVLIGSMVAVGNATDAVFEAQSDGVSSPATAVIVAPGGGGETIRLEDLGPEDIVPTGLAVVPGNGNRWAISFGVQSQVPLAEGTVVPVTGTWEARFVDASGPGPVLITEPVSSCIVQGNVCIIERTFRSQGGSEANVNEARYVDLVINSYSFPDSEWVGPLNLP